MTDMRVIEHGAGGAPDVMAVRTRPVPSAKPGEILIKVSAAGVNGPDLKQRKGNYPPPPGASDLMGLEVSGHVAELGTAGSGFAVGDPVCALTNGGGYAEYVSVPAGQCLPVPDGVDLIDAAGLCETFFTVWSNVWFCHDVPEDGTMLVHGGGGGIGSTAVQLGKAFGQRVFTTAGSDASRTMAARMGADQVINYRELDFVDVLAEAGGADIIVDFMGGDYTARNLKCTKMDTRIIQLAFDQGHKVEISLIPFLVKRVSLTGAALRPRPPEFKAGVAADLKDRVWPLFSAGKLQTVTQHVFAFEDVIVAHELMEEGKHSGKVLLKL
ncbi:MAG: NAD(P)H-quinone oxidoreductase [Pseudomonadota bacterium]